jgi:hypothetical protein
MDNNEKMIAALQSEIGKSAMEKGELLVLAGRLLNELRQPSANRDVLIAEASAVLDKVVQGGEVAPPLLTIAGSVCEIGDLEGEGGQRGVLVKRGEGDFVTVKGLSMDEVRELVPLFCEGLVAISFAPAPVATKKEQS